MATIFLNGGSPNFAGAIFTNADELLTLIQNTLEEAGWDIVSLVPGVNLFVSGTTLVNEHSCWVEFAIASNILTIRGWQQPEKTNGSPNAIHTHPFTIGGENRLWLTADEDSGCLCIWEASTGNTAGTHFGFLDRFEETDQWAWMIGRLRSDGLGFAYPAKAKYNNANWTLLSSQYISSTNFTSQAQMLPLSTFDLLSQGKPGNGSWGNAGNFNADGGRNAFLNAQNGRVNYNGMAVINNYYYIEGRAETDYTSQGISLYFRGFVKHAFTGVASLSPLNQVLDPMTNNRILSTGGLMWQGMRIL